MCVHHTRFLVIFCLETSSAKVRSSVFRHPADARLRRVRTIQYIHIIKAQTRRRYDNIYRVYNK